MEKLKVQVWIYFRGVDGLRVLVFKMIEARGGFWQPVTGGVEDGERVEAAALREATEETGLAFASAPFALDFEFGFDGRGARGGMRFREIAFGLAARAPAPAESGGAQPRLPIPALDPREHVECRWVTPDDARALLHFNSNGEGLAALLRKITP